ncbi:MAG: CRTAC1 family protein [Thermoanaerobaculia bacterium]
MLDTLGCQELCCVLVLGVAVATLAGCERPESESVAVGVLALANLPPLPPVGSEGVFADVTLAAGITAEHHLPGDDFVNIVDSLGSGAAFADLDGDDWLDLIVVGGPSLPGEADWPPDHSGVRVFRNLRDGRFADVTTDSGIAANETAIAVAVADIDGDGDRDVYLVDRGPNRLYRNRGDATFEIATDEAGLGHPGFGVSAVFFDMDGDYDLDLYLGNYLEFDERQSAFFAPDGFPGPLSYEAQPDVLYENLGNGRFVDVSEPAGIADLRGRTMSVAALDFDNDTDTDLFVASDATENYLLLNDGSGRFDEAGFEAGVAMGENGEQTGAMAVAVGDVDGDGQLDLAVSDTAYGALYRRVGDALFADDVMLSGLAPLCGQYVSWGQNLLDYDNDGDLDLFVVNGDLHHVVGWEDMLLRNDGGARFRDASLEGGFYFEGREVGRSSIVGDYDNDGDLDLFVTAVNGRHFLLRNDSPPGPSWISVDLSGDRVRDPFGARIEIQAGDRAWASEYRFNSAYLGQSDSRVHFGLGEGVDVVDRLRVIWPDGTEVELTRVETGRTHRIERGAA